MDCLVTDTHLRDDNIELVEDIFEQAIDIAIKHQLSSIKHGGDFFDNRKHQTERTLQAAKRIFGRFEEEEIELDIIPGNHDKSDYKSEDRYLDIYANYPFVNVIKDWRIFHSRGFVLHMVPFFCEKTTYSKYLDLAFLNYVEGRKNILLTHVGVNGVLTNDDEEVSELIDKKSFKQFDKVLVGHYHDTQTIDNITYIGSTYQKNYGEDDKKGATLLFDDGTIEQVRFKFPTFKTVKVDLAECTEEQIVELTKGDVEDENASVRVKIKGTKEQIAALNRNNLSRIGLDVKTESHDPVVDISYMDHEFKGFNKDLILEEWEPFSEKLKLTEEQKTEGLTRLTEKL